MELTYRKCGDYYIPNLTLRDSKEYSIGKYGWMRRTYLEKHRPFLYHELLVTERLMAHLEEIDTACREQLEVMEKDMMAQEGVTEALKAAIRWSGYGVATLFAAVRKRLFCGNSYTHKTIK